MNVTVSQAAAALREADEILILTHRRPDGDTTGCAGALCRGLRQLGKTAYILPNAEITPRYQDMITPCYSPAEFSPKFVVTTDVADYKMLSDNAEEYKERIDLALDHHRSNPGIGRQNLIVPEAGGCAEVVYDVLCALGVSLTAEIARCIYIGVSTDTGCFRYSNTTSATLRAAAACLDAGIDGGELNRMLFETKSWARFQMERIVFDTMEMLRDGKIAVVILRRSDIDRTGATNDDLDSIASLTRQIEGVQVGITLTENKNGTVKASVRTTKEVDASAICKICGGGGHLRAAGASFAEGVNAEQAREQLLQAAETVYNRSELAD